MQTIVRDMVCNAVCANVFVVGDQRDGAARVFGGAAVVCRALWQR